MKRLFLGFFALGIAVSFGGCASDQGAGEGCSALSGTPWVPNVPGAGASNHDATTAVAQSAATGSGTVIGLADPAPTSVEIDVPVDMTADLGQYGSLSLVAQASSLPSGYQGGIYPLLVYLSDGTNEYINLARDTGACGTQGFYQCTSSSCEPNSLCTVSWPSAYTDRPHWEEHQILSPNATGFPSVNTFPTCNWSGGSPPSDPGDPACAFNTHFFTGTPARLRYGVTYHAKYVLMATSYGNMPGVPGGALGGYAPVTANLTVTVVKKTDASLGGAFDLNVVLVGNNTINASRTPQGQNNLNTLFATVQSLYEQSGTSIKLGAINAIEWPCSQGGDAYDQVDVNPSATNFTGNMIAAASAVIPAGTAGKAVNIFLVSSIADSSLQANLEVAGISAAIGGPMINGSPASGVTFATFGKLASLNPSCSSSPCASTTLDPEFAQMQSTVAHELGHYFGLNHPSEATGTTHDVVQDTPICTATDSTYGFITVNSCLNSDTNAYQGSGAENGKTCQQSCPGYNSTTHPPTFCPAAIACQFNHIMWWTSKNYDPAAGLSDGDLFSPDTGLIINYNPFIQ